MKKIFSILLLCAAVIFAGCSKDEPVPVTGVTLDKATLSLKIAETAILVATITPNDATVSTVAWSSDKPDIATVDATGKVTAVKAGTATITVASTTEMSKTATCVVTVTPSTIAVTSVTLNKTTLSLNAGAKETLTATIIPADATNKHVVWESDHLGVATVISGEVTAIKAGTATIRVTSLDGFKEASCTVTVTEEPSLTWATGNLVADGVNGAKIGTATDGGLYFQFGSLVGWSETGDPAIAVSPVDYTGSTTFSSSWTGDPATKNTTIGTGDPCKYYLGGTWRLPTTDEYMTLFNNTTTGWTGAADWSLNETSHSATNSALGLTFPASGFRSGSDDGSLYNVGSFGYYWSASPKDASKGYSLDFGKSNVQPSTNSLRATALPVRCVQDTSN